MARRLAALGRSVTVVEAESDSERHTSARGSWVIHSGIYYPPGSLKVPPAVTSAIPCSIARCCRSICALGLACMCDFVTHVHAKTQTLCKSHQQPHSQ